MSNFWRSLSCIAAGVSVMAGTIASFGRHHRHPMCGCHGGRLPMYPQYPQYPFIPLGGYWNNPRQTFNYPAYPTTPVYPTTAQPPQTIVTQPTSADAVGETHSFTLGKELSTLKSSKNPTKFVTDEWSENDKKSLSQKDAYIHQQKYIQFASNLGKSLINYIDRHKSAGNKDGYLSKDEFSKYYAMMVGELERKTLKSNGKEMSQERVAELRAAGERVFDILNVVKDDKLDWKEIGTMMAISDRDDKGTYDGEITYLKFVGALKVFADKTQEAESKLNVENTYKQMYLQG